MKNLPVFNKSGTLEDIVFENRNKAYGAYEMNRKCMKYLLIAFFATLLGVSSAVAVPFLKALKGTGEMGRLEKEGITIQISSIKPETEQPIIPEVPPVSGDIETQAAYLPPKVVENADESQNIPIYDDLILEIKNDPVDDTHLEVVPEEQVGIDEDSDLEVLFPEEHARFRGGDVSEFRSWVIENITYPPLAAELGIFGKVIVEFCVNSKGEVVDIRFIRSLDPLVDNEVLRVITASPEWIPARQGGRPVKQRFTIPFQFQVQK
jgi:periplasmic protein TonB